MTGSPPLRYDLCDEVHDRPAWAGPPRRSVLVCAHPRSGSTMLGEALFFAGLGSPLEYVHAGSRGGFEARWGVAGLGALVREAWRRRTEPDGTFAAKLFWRDVADLAAALAPGAFPDLLVVSADQVPPATYRALARLLGNLFPNPVHVYLERRDRLRQAVSGLAAAQTGAWRSIPGVENAGAAEVAYDFDRIDALVAGSAFCHAHWLGYFEANGIVSLAVVYEELVVDYPGVAGRLLRALGHPREAPPVRMERQATAATEALVRRYLRDRRARG